MKTKIALDALGGEHAPASMVKGALEACLEYGIEVVLVGDGNLVRHELERNHSGDLTLSLVEASETVDLGESPTQAFRLKRDSSIAVGLNLLKKGEVSAFVSAGNTGAIMTAALLILGRVKEIKRPALGILIFSPSGPFFIVDAGANSDCKPPFLLQFAHMGSAYMKGVFDLQNPRVALLSNGEEETKGNQLCRETHLLLKKSGLNFVGNIEGKDLPKCLADVVVTDGFTGNVVIKLIEGLGEAYTKLLQDTLTETLSARVASFLMKPALRALGKRLDYAEYGGAPLLGVMGNVVIAHGRSNAKAVKSALRLAKQMAEHGVLELTKNIGKGKLESKEKPLVHQKQKGEENE